MLTIRAMARMGPWLLSHLDVLDGLDEHCQRCGEPIRYVHVMTLHEGTSSAETWRIGSTCGPLLEGMSDALWKSGTVGIERRWRLAARIITLQGHSSYGVGREALAASILDERLPALLDGSLPEPKLRHLRGVVGSMEKRFR